MHDLSNGSGMSPASRRRFIQTMLAGGAAATLPGFNAYAAALGTVSPAAAASSNRLRLTNPFMNAVSSEVLDQLKYAFTAAAAGAPGTANPFARPCRAYIASRKPARQASLRTTATATLAQPAARAAQFGRYAAIEPAAFLATDARVSTLHAGIVRKPAGFAVDALPPDQSDDFHFAPDGFLSDAEIKKKQEKEDHDTALQADIAKGKAYTHMEVRLYEVSIKADTGDSGDYEEIAMGGAVIGATGHLAKIKRFLVADDFDTDSDDRHHKKYYNINGWHLGWFNIHQEKPFPHYYTAQLAMAELDNGGFGDFLADLWDTVGDFVKILIDDALSSVLGPIGYAIGEIVGAFLDWFIGLFQNEDDILGVTHPSMKFSSQRYSRYLDAGLISGNGHKRTLTYRGAGGKYEAIIGWKVMTDEQFVGRKAYIAQHAHMYNQAEQEAR